MSIGPLEFPSVSSLGALGGANGLVPADLSGAAATSGAEFGDLLVDGLDRIEGLTDSADTLAVEAATGELANIHDYTIAASEAQVATQLTVAVRNKAVEAFTEIMRMQV